MFLLIDIGATHIKYGVPFKFLGEITAPEGSSFSLSSIREKFESILDIIDFEPKSIFLSTQMHGFYLENDENYTSWKCEDGNIFEIPRETGLFPKKGLPIINISKRNGKFLTLGDALLTNDMNVIHDTIMCGTGFYDIIHNKIIDNYGLEFKKVVRGAPVIAGTWKNIPIYTALGDFQTAIASVSPSPDDIVINLGTGSQIAKLSYHFNNECENRCYFDGRFVNCITHIPSGRAIDVFMKIFNIRFDDFSSISIEDIESSNVIFDLGIFESAYGYRNGGFVSNINEYTTRNNLISSLLRCYLNQYISISKKFRPFNKIFLTGGIQRKLGIIKPYFEKFIGVTVISCEHDTIIGLSKILKDFDLI